MESVVAMHMVQTNYATFPARVNTRQRLADRIIKKTLVLMVYDALSNT